MFVCVDAELSQFPQRTINGYKLDLFGLYHNVVARGGFPRETNGSASKVPWSWSREIFQGMANYTIDNRCTSVGHDLIQSYKKYLLDYEEKHPEDVHTEGLNKKVASTIPRGEKTIRVKLSTGAPRKRPASGDPRGGRGRGRGRGRPRGSGRGRGRPRAAVAPRRGNNFNFSIGNRVRVYWPSDDTWYSGMVVMQETTPEGVVYSKIDYDDGDEEVLNLANEICECLDEDEDGLVYRPRPSSRRGVDGGAPGRLALEYHGGHENETMREPISMEQVLEAMNCREAARGLYELSGERHEGRETFRLGYMMGVRRAAFKAVDVMHAILARAFPEGDPMRDLVTREDLHKAVVDGTYEAEAESDREEEPPEDEANDPIETKNYDAPWPKDKNVPTEQEVLEELEGLRARAAEEKLKRATSVQSLDADGNPKLVLKMKRSKSESGGDLVNNPVADATAATDVTDAATSSQPPNASADASGPVDADVSATPLADQRRIALNKIVNVEYAGDKTVLRWLDNHGWGHFAGAFAAYGVSRRVLNYLTMTDLENMHVDASVRESIFKALDRRRKRNEKYRLKGT